MTEPDKIMIHDLRVAVRTAVAGKSLRMGSELCGVSKRTLQRAMNGENIQVQTFLRIAEAGGYRIRFLLEKDTK
jgi:Helix-turn-helix